MGIYFNWPPPPPEQPPDSHEEILVSKSREAGAAILDAISAGTRLLRIYEDVPKDIADWLENRKVVASALQHASHIYKELQAEASEEPVPLSPAMRHALVGLIACSQVLSGPLLRASIDDLSSELTAPRHETVRLSPRRMMLLAHTVTGEASLQLSERLPGPDRTPYSVLTARQVAAGLAVIQLLGVAVAELLERRAIRGRFGD